MKDAIKYMFCYNINDFLLQPIVLKNALPFIDEKLIVDEGIFIYNSNIIVFVIFVIIVIIMIFVIY